jgi:hypothetical protein
VKVHRVVRCRGPQIFSSQSAHRWRQGCQLYEPAALYPAGRFFVLISVRGWVDPKVIVQLEGLGKLKKSTSLGLDIASQCLNQLRYPSIFNNSNLIVMVIVSECVYKVEIPQYGRVRSRVSMGIHREYPLCSAIFWELPQYRSAVQAEEKAVPS